MAIKSVTPIEVPREAQKALAWNCSDCQHTTSSSQDRRTYGSLERVLNQFQELFGTTICLRGLLLWYLPAQDSFTHLLDLCRWQPAHNLCVNDAQSKAAVPD